MAVHLFMITNFIYHAVPRAKRCPGAESRAVVRMFTVVDDAPKVVFYQMRISLFAYLIESKLAAAQPPRASASVDV